MNLVGSRVLRGPDWSQANIDGGDGHIGTIVNIGGLNTAQVQWDNGQQCVCRIGENGHHDLRIFDSGPVGVRHLEFVCSSCSERGIFGMRWQCKQCSDVNLCPVCYVTDKHNINHPFVRFDTPQSHGVDIPKRSSGVKCQAMGIFPGATVKRGRDWKWDKQDGGDGKTGEVVSINNNKDSSSVRNVVNVKWSSTGRTNSYRLGGLDGKVDLMFVEQSRGPFYYRDHLPVCMKKVNVNQGASSSGVARETGPGSSIMKEGDKVCITVSNEDLKKLKEQHGDGFVRSMQNCKGKVGEVKGFTQNGDAWVDFNGSKLRLFPGVLSQVYDFKEGDIVRILEDEEKVKNFQDGHGGYNNKMKPYLGKVGQVIKSDSDGDLRVKFGSINILYNPMCCLPAPGEEVYEGSVEDSDLGEIMPNLLGLNNALMMMMFNGLAEAVSESVIGTLFVAINTDDISMVRTVLNDNPEFVNTEHQDMTPLYLATFNGHRAIVIELLRRGADIDKADKNGATPLLVAIARKKTAVGKLLIEKGANVKIVYDNGRTALHHAAYRDEGNLVEMIIRKGGDVNLQDSDRDTALHDAITKGSNESVAVLCRVSKLNPGLTNKKGHNVLHHATFIGRTFAVDKILDRHKSMVNAKKSDGFTALHVAALNNHTECAKLLIGKGNADVDSRDKDGHTPLMLASLKGCLECVKFLIEKNADVNAVDRNKCSPLHACCVGQSSTGNTHQLLAAMMGLSLGSDVENRIRVAWCLIQNGARTDLENMNGRTPLQCCTDENMKRSLSEFIRERLGGASASSSRGSDLIWIRCVLCIFSTATATLQPCGHKCVCRDCATVVIRCPVCDQKVSNNDKCCIQ